MSRLKLDTQVSLTGCVPVNVESGAKYEYGTGLSACERFPSHAELLGFRKIFCYRSLSTRHKTSSPYFLSRDNTMLTNIPNAQVLGSAWTEVPGLYGLGPVKLSVVSFERNGQLINGHFARKAKRGRFVSSGISDCMYPSGTPSTLIPSI